MNKKQIRNLIVLLNQAGILKDVKRTGWWLKGIKGFESVADHTWRMGLLISLLTPKNLNKEKLLEMNTIHDLGEIGVGDIKWETGKRAIGSQSRKLKNETAVIKTIFGKYIRVQNISSF